MAKIVAIVNQKGGVGKTTSCVNLAAALKAAGQRILLCDFDPQANATSGMGVDKTVSNGIYDVLINSVETEKAVFRDLQEAAKRWEEQAAQTMIQKKRYGGFAAARRRVYAAGSDPPALCGELRKEETALCGQ